MSAVAMSKRIEVEKEGKKLADIKELILDGCSATEIEGLNDEFSSLEHLSVANVGLTTLSGMPSLPALKKLDASGNPIAGGLDALLNCPNLVSLNLSGNKLSNVSDLATLASLDSLTRLELNDCELATLENYRKEVFAVLPNLRYLDGLDQNGIEETQNVGPDGDINGVSNGHVPPKDESDQASEDEDGESSEEPVENGDAPGSEEDDEIGLSVLQGSKELEDDDGEDYVPGDDDDEEDDDIEEEGIEDELAALSGEEESDRRCSVKRPAEDIEAEGVSEAKCRATDDGEAE
ncbi:unnamed protein product [Mesocestoides corti]|uniref:LRRcap domain-containing protein n=1 Tax=Mesocestoides corti TaxID=53468 RepID=A0A0R3UJU0_MESCO|nr:unnamed protein product [Mesocestoides corti]